MHSHELTTGRTFGARFDPGESFFPALEDFCRDKGIRHGYVPMFLAAFAEPDVVGACDKLDDPAAPVWSKVHLTNAEALGCGTIAYDEQARRILPHIHTTLGLKEHSAAGYTSHLLAARVQFPGRDDPRRGHHPRDDPARGPRTLRCTAAELRRPAGILTGRCHGKRSTVLPFPGDARRRPLTPLSV